MSVETQKYRKFKKKSSPIKSFFSYFKKILGYEPSLKEKREFVKKNSKTFDLVTKSNFISRDLSWLKFDERVLDQARNPKLSIFERLKFLAITASNLDDFFAIRIGSLYNYLDLGRERTDYSGLREGPFLKTLMGGTTDIMNEIDELYLNEILPNAAGSRHWKRMLVIPSSARNPRPLSLQQYLFFEIPSLLRRDKPYFGMTSIRLQTKSIKETLFSSKKELIVIPSSARNPRRFKPTTIFSL